MAAEQTLVRPLVFPIGHYCGATPATEDETQRQHEVRRGPEVVGLDDAAFSVWSLAHGDPDAGDDAAWGSDQVLGRAEQAGVTGAGKLFDRLVAEELCVRVPSGTPAARDFAQAYQLHPAMLGLGNTPEDPDLYGIGFIGTPVLRVSRAVFEVWRWAPIGHNLWQACEFFAEMEREHGADDPEATDPDHVLTGVLDTLHGLLAPGAAYLDVAR